MKDSRVHVMSDEEYEKVEKELEANAKRLQRLITLLLVAGLPALLFLLWLLEQAK